MCLKSSTPIYIDFMKFSYCSLSTATLDPCYHIQNPNYMLKTHLTVEKAHLMLNVPSILTPVISKYCYLKPKIPVP